MINIIQKKLLPVNMEAVQLHLYDRVISHLSGHVICSSFRAPLFFIINNLHIYNNSKEITSYQWRQYNILACYSYMIELSPIVQNMQYVNPLVYYK